MYCFIRHGDMQGIAVRIRIDGYGEDTHLSGGMNNATGNFSTVCNQDFFKHSHSLSMSVYVSRKMQLTLPVHWWKHEYQL